MVQTKEKIDVRNASLDEILSILEMIDGEIFKENSGTLLAVTPADIYARIEKGNAFGAYSGGKIIGFASLVEYSGLAEMATVYVSPEFRGAGISSMLMDKVVERAAENYDTLYAYTNQVALPKFMQWGFKLAEYTPQKFAAYCQQCPKYEKSCNEIAVALQLPK